MKVTLLNNSVFHRRRPQTALPTEKNVAASQVNPVTLPERGLQTIAKVFPQRTARGSLLDSTSCYANNVTRNVNGQKSRFLPGAVCRMPVRSVPRLIGNRTDSIRGKKGVVMSRVAYHDEKQRQRSRKREGFHPNHLVT